MLNLLQTEIASLKNEIQRRDEIIKEKDEEILRLRNAMSALIDSLPCKNECTDCNVRMLKAV